MYPYPYLFFAGALSISVCIQYTKQTQTAYSASVYQNKTARIMQNLVLSVSTLFLLYDENACHMWCAHAVVVVDTEPFLLHSRLIAAAFPLR